MGGCERQNHGRLEAGGGGGSGGIFSQEIFKNQVHISCILTVILTLIPRLNSPLQPVGGGGRLPMALL